LLADLSVSDEKFVVAKGGRGGRGNIHFKSSTNRAPRRADPGEAGEERWIQLELKLLADVGLLGKPNAGKSTLLSKISNARPKIADYPFTTLQPILGVVEPFHSRGRDVRSDAPTFTVADIPGLIEGAHQGTGLGHQFLRHIERTKIFLHLIDVSDFAEDPLQSYEEIRKELKAYNPQFIERPEWIVLTKIDLIKDASLLADYRKRFEKKKKKVFPISAVTGEGIRELITKLAEVVKKP
jgi:GTPase